MAELELRDKILWVCRENIGRSQVAEALWERNMRGVEAASAGIFVDKPNQPLGTAPEADILIKVMEREYGIDMRDRTRTSLDDFSHDELGRAAMIIVLAEPEVVPDSLAKLATTIMRPVADLKYCDEVEAIQIIRQIERDVSYFQAGG